MKKKIGVKQKGLIQMKNGNYEIKFSKKAIKDKKNLKNAGLDKITINILTRMIDDPFCYPPSYEKLTGDLLGFYLIRINRQHRIVYKVNEENKEILIYRMWTHYEK